MMHLLTAFKQSIVLLLEMTGGIVHQLVSRPQGTCRRATRLKINVKDLVGGDGVGMFKHSIP